MEVKKKKTKMYIALAENGKGEILGLCEKNSCCKKLHWSKSKVRLFLPRSMSSLKPIDWFFIKYKDSKKINDKKFMLKTLRNYRNIDKKDYVICGNTLYQYGYRYVKNMAENTKTPKGFTYRVYRVNSKNCPVTVDLNYFLYIKNTHPKKENIDRYAYCNPCFFENLSHILVP